MDPRLLFGSESCLGMHQCQQSLSAGTQPMSQALCRWPDRTRFTHAVCPDAMGRESKNNKAEGDDGRVDILDGACRDAASWDIACLRAITNGQAVHACGIIPDVELRSDVLFGSAAPSLG